MKNRILQFTFALFLMAGAGLVLSSCETDPCKDVECGANGFCLDGVCICNPGYEADASGQCTVRSADKFVGTYQASETCVGGVMGTYNMTVTASSVDADIILIEGLGDFLCTNGSRVVARAVVDKSDITLEEGPFCPSTAQAFSGYWFSGSGSLSATNLMLDISYTEIDTFQGTSQSFTCTVNATKQ
jgi:hypothetical protein